MMSGVPVLVTAFSAHMDFCDEQNSWLLDFRFEGSQSHVRTSNSNWARVRVSDLALKMRKIFTALPDFVKERDEKRTKAFAAASALTWDRSAQKTEQFVDTVTMTPPSKSKLKLAWISTWNTRCGIASYSEFIVDHLPENSIEVSIFANEEPPNTPDSPSVRRAWFQSGETNSIADVAKAIVDEGHDAVVIQHNFGFFTLEALAEAVSYLEANDVCTYVFFHRTEDLLAGGQVRSIASVASHLRAATRLMRL
jgi:hypothetical protein